MKYLYLIRTSLLELVEYRANIPARSVAFVINLSLTLFLWLAVTGVKKEIFSYARSDIILYYLFLSAVLPLVTGGVDFSQRIGYDIKNGDLGGILLKPVTPLRYYMSLAISERAKDFLMTFPLVVLIGVAFHIRFSLGVSNAILLVASLLFTFLLNHLFMAIVGLVAFWTTEIGWTSTFIGQVISLFSGVRFPTNFYPSAVLAMVGMTPFLYFGFFPAEIFLKGGAPNLAQAFLVQSGWLIFLFVALRYVWLKGLKRYEGASQ